MTSVCVCPATVSLTYANDKCTQYCDGKCIKKSCTPTANQSNCTNGTQNCDNGCGQNTRKCCIACTHHEKNGGCEKDCIANTCSGYTLAGCPTTAICATCSKQTTTCGGGATMSKITGCKSGYKVSGNSCVKAYVSRACQNVGDILYDDKTCAGVNDTLDPSKTVIGVVFDVNRKLALAFHENTVSRMSWAPAIEKKISNLYFSNFFEAENDFNGKKNTEIILSQTNAFDTPAKYCHNYDPYNRGTWYLPAAGELKLIYNNLSTLNNSLSKVNGELLSNGDYLSSSMYTNYVAWTINFRNGLVIKYSTPMNDPKSYRPVLAF